VCGLGVLVNPDLSVRAAGGFLVQLLPGATDEMIDKLEENINRLPPVSKMIETGMTPEQIAMEVLAGFEPEVLYSYHMDYVCDCTRERVERAIISLGKEEIQSMIDEEEQIEVGCQFCEKKYTFTRKDLKELLK